jgi:hypothetical protein
MLIHTRTNLLIIQGYFGVPGGRRSNQHGLGSWSMADVSRAKQDVIPQQRASSSIPLPPGLRFVAN